MHGTLKHFGLCCRVCAAIKVKVLAHALGRALAVARPAPVLGNFLVPTFLVLRGGGVCARDPEVGTGSPAHRVNARTTLSTLRRAAATELPERLVQCYM